MSSKPGATHRHHELRPSPRLNNRRDVPLSARVFHPLRASLRRATAIGRAPRGGLARLLAVLALLLPGSAVRAATPAPGDRVAVAITVLDAGGQPLAGVTAGLVLVRYGDFVAEVPVGSCRTDQAGTCTIAAAGPPRLPSGWIEGFLDLGDAGRQRIGWQGPQFALTVQLDARGRLATPFPPLDRPYDLPETRPAASVPPGLAGPPPAAPVDTAAAARPPVTTAPSPTGVPDPFTPGPLPAAAPTAAGTPDAPDAPPLGGPGWGRIGLALLALLVAGALARLLRQRKRAGASRSGGEDE